MLRIELTADALTRVRFAVSPLWEVVASTRVLASPRDHPMHRPWLAAARPALAPDGTVPGMLAALVPVPTRTIAGFLSPPPLVADPDLDLELATLVAVDPGQVAADLSVEPYRSDPRLEPLRRDPASGLQELAATIRAYWDAALAPHWPRLRTALENDVRYRAYRLASRGIEGLLDDLDPEVRWGGGALRVANPYVDRTVRLDARGLLLVPSAFVWPRVFAKLDPEWQPVLRYPPRGVAELWRHTSADPPAALAAVLGRARARLLAELDLPASTTDLARRTGLSAGGVSQHLTLLREAGLVTAHRAGRFVLYARTGVAEALLTHRVLPGGRTGEAAGEAVGQAAVRSSGTVAASEARSRELR